MELFLESDYHKPVKFEGETTEITLRLFKK